MRPNSKTRLRLHTDPRARPLTLPSIDLGVSDDPARPRCRGLQARRTVRRPFRPSRLYPFNPVCPAGRDRHKAPVIWQNLNWIEARLSDRCTLFRRDSFPRTTRCLYRRWFRHRLFHSIQKWAVLLPMAPDRNIPLSISSFQSDRGLSILANEMLWVGIPLLAISGLVYIVKRMLRRAD